ncbi:MAG: DUF4062 domain-containing protein [Acholeplasma sp.]|nr:DUF4062 domain-containing protein [Acholeplasma sp.]
MKERIIKVFVSSTFKDMHAERDYMVHHVFPKLRHDFLKFGLHIIEIDLRWGVTKEEAENDQVLEICLDQIDQARPFFVALLGERYGWIPDTIKDTSSEKYPWISDYKGKVSMTHLEILHGILNDENARPYTHVFIREPFDLHEHQALSNVLQDLDFLTTEKLGVLKESLQSYFKEEGKEHIYTYKSRFAGIKFNREQVEHLDHYGLEHNDIEFIKAKLDENLVLNVYSFSLLCEDTMSKLIKISVPYVDQLEDFGSKLYEKLYAHIYKNCVEDKEEEKHWSFSEHLIHEAYQINRMRHFTGREDVIKIVKDSVKEQPVLLIHGNSGSGKSSFLSKICKDLSAEMNTVIIYSGISLKCSNIKSCLYYLIHQLNDQYHLIDFIEENWDYQTIKEKFHMLCYQLDDIEPVLIIIDALNQLQTTYSPEIFDWIPNGLNNVRFLLSSTEGIYLEQAQKLCYGTYQLDILNDKDSIEMIQRYLLSYRKMLSQEQMRLLLAKTDIQAPLYIVLVTEILRSFPKFEELSDLITDLPGTMSELFEFFINDLMVNHSKNIVRDTLSWISLSPYGILESDIFSLYQLSYKEVMPHVKWSSLYYELMMFLTNLNQDEKGLMLPFHQSFKQAIDKLLLSDEQERYVQVDQLAQLGEEVLNMQLDYVPHNLRFLGKYLYELKSKERLVKLLTIISTQEENHPLYEVFETLIFEIAQLKDNVDYLFLDEVFEDLLNIGHAYNVAKLMLQHVTLPLNNMGYTSMAYYLSHWFLNFSKQITNEHKELMIAAAAFEVSRYALFVTTTEEALTYGFNAYEIFESELQKDSRLSLKKDLAEIADHLADICHKIYDYENEMIYRNKVIELYEEILTEDSSHMLTYERYLQTRSMMIEHHTKLSTEEKKSLSEKLIMDIEAYLALNPNSMGIIVILIRLKRYLCDFLPLKERHSCYLDLYQISLELQAKNPKNVMLLYQDTLILQDLSQTCQKLQDTSGWDMYSKIFEEHAKKLIHTDPNHQQYEKSYLRSLSSRGHFQLAQHGYQEALPYFKSIYDILFSRYQYMQITDDVSDEIIQASINYSNCLYETHQYTEVLQHGIKGLNKAKECTINPAMHARLTYVISLAYYQIDQQDQFIYYMHETMTVHTNSFSYGNITSEQYKEYYSQIFDYFNLGLLNRSGFIFDHIQMILSFQTDEDAFQDMIDTVYSVILKLNDDAYYTMLMQLDLEGIHYLVKRLYLYYDMTLHLSNINLIELIYSFINRIYIDRIKQSPVDDQTYIHVANLKRMLGIYFYLKNEDDKSAHLLLESQSIYHELLEKQTSIDLIQQLVICKMFLIDLNTIKLNDSKDEYGFIEIINQLKEQEHDVKYMDVWLEKHVHNNTLKED